MSIAKAVLLISLGLSVQVHGATISGAEESSWQETGLSMDTIDGLISEKYCSKNERFFRGCFAAVDELAHLMSPPQKIVLGGTSLKLVAESATPPQSNIEKKEYWKSQRVKYQLVEKYASEALAAQLVKQYQQLRGNKSNFKPFEVARILNASSMYTYDYLTKYEPQNYENAVSEGVVFSSLGLLLERRGASWEVGYVTKNSEAEFAGLQKGDVIVAIDHQEVEGINEVQLQKMVNEKKAANVLLDVDRRSQKLAYIVNTVPVNYSEFTIRKIEYGGKTWGYLYLPDFFNDEICRQLSSPLEELNEETQGMILDLRGNSSGLKLRGGCFLGLLVGSNKEIYESRNIFDGQVGMNVSTGEMKQKYKKPIVVLQDTETNGVAEFVSGNLKVMGRAVVVGQRSFGNGTEQIKTELGRLTHVETAYLSYLANGQTVQLRGVTPQIEIYKFLKPARYETDFLRMEDLGINPIQGESIQPLQEGLKELTAPLECVASRGVEQQFVQISDFNWTKDLQLLTGLATLSCW